MAKSILKSVVAGLLFGAAAFFMPKFVLGILVIGLLFRLFHGCGGGHGHRRCCGGGRFHHVFDRLDKVRAMSDEEYSEFKNNHGKCCSSNSKSGCCDSSTK